MTATWPENPLQATEPRTDRPGAAKVLTTSSAHVVAFSFAAGQELKEHAAHHAAIIQCLSGRLEFTVADETRTLEPGAMVHLTPKLKHAVHALEDSVLTVTMLVGAPADEE